jgi:adenine-specific DNA methylase
MKWASKPVERIIVDGKPIQLTIKGETDCGQQVNSIHEVLGGTKRFYVTQADFRSFEIQENFVDYVVTDPPYYDSVQYSDLSTFFRVWLHQLLPDEADWHYDPRASAVAEEASKGQAYGRALSDIWRKCHKSLKKPDGRLIFTFHHWNPAAWAELTLSLQWAEFTLSSRFVVHSENPSSVHIHGLRSLTHDCIFVLKPKNEKEHEIKRWTKLECINTTDSYLFCADCGGVLGFLLESNLSEDEIRQTWQNLI